MSWASLDTPDDAAASTQDHTWVEAFRGIDNDAGSDLADVLLERLSNGPANRAFNERELRAVALRITTLQSIVEQSALTVERAEAEMRRAQDEATEVVQQEAVTRQATAGVRMGAAARQEAAAAKIAAAREQRTRLPSRSDEDRNTREANPLGGDR